MTAPGYSVTRTADSLELTRPDGTLGFIWLGSCALPIEAAIDACPDDAAAVALFNHLLTNDGQLPAD